MEIIEWGTLNSGDTPIAYCTAAVCMAAHTAIWWSVMQLKFVPEILPKPLGRPRRRWEDNIKMDLQELGRWYTDWIQLAQDRDSWRTLVNAVMNLWVS